MSEDLGMPIAALWLLVMGRLRYVHGEGQRVPHLAEHVSLGFTNEPDQHSELINI